MLNGLLRAPTARAGDALRTSYGQILDAVTPNERRNLFTAVRYEPD